jgi:hypothetical protein
MTKATEIRDKIFAASKILHEISNDLAKPVEWDGIDITYLEKKVIGDVGYIAKDITAQLKYLKK